MARLIPQKQIEEINQFRDSISVNNSVFISGSLLVSQSINIGSNPLTKQRVTGSVEITGSLEIDGPLTFANAESRLDATASFADVSVDTQLFGGIRPQDFGAMDATLYVSSTSGDDNNDGRTPQFPLRTIKKAAKIATDGDDGRFGLPTGSLFTGFRIEVAAGTYLEDNPIELPKNTTIWGAGLRVTKVLAKNETEDLFWVNSGNYLAEMTFGNLRVYPSVDNSQKGFAISFAPNAFITTSPYVQNCSMISNQENSFLEAYEEIPPGGGGLNVDGNRIHPDSPLASMVLDAYTQVAPNGVGCQVVGRGFIQLVSFFTNFSAYSVKVLNGGQAVLLNSNTSFGDYGMYASGSRFITGSNGNNAAFLNVQNNYSIIVDTIEKGLSAIPALVPNTNDGIRATSPDDYPQYFTNQDSTADVAEIVKSDYRLISSIVENGDYDIPTLIAKSSTKGYSPTSVYNISGQTQLTSSISGSSDDIDFIDTNFDIVLDIIQRGNAATSSYAQISNVSESIKVTTTNSPQLYGDTDSYVKSIFEDRFDTIISIVDGGLRFTPRTIESNTSGSFKFSDITPYQSDISSSFDIYSSVSASLSIVYDIVANGTGSLPTTMPSSSIERPEIEYQNAYTLLKENIPFIQEETILYLSSSWSEFEYNQETCKRDIGYIISGAAHDILYGGNEESLRSGLFYYLYPSDATTTQLDPTLTGIKYASELALNILSNKQFRDTESGIDTGYNVIFDNKDFVRDETIAYISSSWSEFEYSEAKCRRDIGYIMDAIGTDLKYGGNERSVQAGQFYYKYPSLATVDNRTVGQKQQTLDALKYAKRITQKLLENTTFVTASESRVGAVELIRDNRSLIQDETITYINTKYPNFEYNQTKCRRDVGYIVDNVATDLLYGGNERSELAGLYYFLYPSIANTTQLEETLEGVRYAKGITKEIASSNLLDTPKIILNTDGNIKVTSFEPTSSLVSGGEFEVKIVSQSFGIIEDIIRYGTDSIKSAIAINSDDFVWDARNPINVSNRNQITSSNQQSSNLQNIEDNFKVVTDIIGGGTSAAPTLTSSWENTIKVSDTEQYLNTSSLATSTEGTIVSESIAIVANIIQNGTGSLPTLEENTISLIKVGNVSQTISANSASLYEAGIVSSSFASITNIVENGTGSIPTTEYNTSESIKFYNDSVQFTGSLSGSLENIESISSSISIVTNIIANGTGSLPTIIEYTTPSTDPATLAAYEILRENIGFIQSESIAYLSSSWSTASYDEAKCRRDIGYIISGAAEDLIWNSNSASIVNGQFYYEIPSQAQGAQLNQTLDGVFYASKLAQKLVQNIEFVTASSERRNAWDLITNNIDFIKEETILYLSSSWSTFDYNEVTCRRDVGYILDAVKTDIYWGGNERSNKAGEFYYLYPSQATIANDGDTGGQLNQTLDGIRYAGRITEEIVQSNEFVTASQAVLDAKELLERNKQFIKDEVVEFISSSWNDFSYNQTTCKRDVGYILDATITDLVYGGNERSRIAAEYYYRYPSSAVVGGVPSSTQQKDPTVDAVKYLGGISEKIVLGEEFTAADSTKLSIRDSIVENKAYIQQNVVEYINDTYPYLNYNKSKCYRDIGFITDAVVTDLVYGGNARSTQAGVFYYLFPSQATDSQKRETIDGINFGRDLAKLIVKGAKSIENNFDDIITIIESGSSITTEQTIGTDSNGAPISTVGIPKNSYGDNLITTVVGTTIPSVVSYTGNAEAGIRFESGSQYTSEVTASSSEVEQVSSSFSIVRDIIEFGISGSLQLTGSSDASTYFEVVTLEQGSYYFNKTQLQKFDDVDGKILGEDTGSFEDGVKDPTLTLKRGELYTFSINSLNIVNTLDIFTKPFFIKRDRSAGSGNLYNEGVTNNGTTFGTITFIVPFDAPDVLYYVNGNDVSASGRFNIVDELPISDTQRYVEVPSRGEFDVITNNVDGIKANDIVQYKNPYTASVAEGRLVSSSFATVVDIITNGTGSLPTLIKNASGNIKKSSLTQYTSSIDATDGIIGRVTASFDIVLDIVENGLSSLPTLIENTNDLIQKTSTTQYTSSLSGSSNEVSNVSASFAIVLDILNNGTGSIPTKVLNIENTIKFDNELPQFTGSLSGSLEDVSFVSSSISIVTEIISIGSGSYLTASLYDTGSGASTNPATLAAYEILRSNIGFIQSESIAYLSSSWTTASYDESKCIRDIGLIISGAAEDLIWNTYSASIVNGKYYLEFPSQAETSQLNQTLDGIFYASRLAQKLVQNVLFVTASTEVSASYNLIRENREFIKDETIAYLSSSWSTFDYNETLCRRDVGHMIDAVSTDLFYGGNERSIKAGEFYYLYPSAATGSQLSQTTDGINYARRLTEKIVGGEVLSSAPESRTNGYDLLFNNREFIQTEVIEYISSSWADFDYDDIKCKRDVGYIVDAVVTDLLYGGNERSSIAGKFYYLYPSDATGSQLIQTLDGIKYAKNLSIELLQNNIFQNASDETIAVSNVITQNKDLIKAEVISYISSSWSTFEYDQSKCERDTGYILDAVVTDFYYGGNERSRTAGEFYYLYPSSATVSGSESPNANAQLYPTVDGVEYAQRLTNKLISNVTLVTASLERQATYNLLFQNKSLIQDEVISYISSSWSDFEYIESKCRRDVGYIIDAVATDVYYGGNERSVTAGEFYYLFPSEATTTQSDQTITGVVHAAGLANKIIQNQLLVTASADIREAYNNILDNKELIQDNVIEFVDMTYPYFTYNRVKCRRDVGYIIDAIATDLLWGGNQRSVIAGDYYYRFPSQATTTQLRETTLAIRYAKEIVKDVILNNVLETPRIIKNTESNIRFTNTEQYSGSMAVSGSNLTLISSSFTNVIDVVSNGLSVLPKQQRNIEGLVKVTDAVQTTNSATEYVPTISSSYAIVLDILQNGLSSIPTIVSNTNGNIKTTNASQYISASASGSLENVEFISSSIHIVSDIITNGSGSYLTASNYVTPSTDESTIAAYQILRENIGFIQSESIAYLSSSWSGFTYNEASCSRDIGLIISGAAEDLIWNVASASIVNGKFYLEYPSQATSSQLDQTLDGIFYASKLAQKLVQNIEFVFADSTIIDSYNSIINEKATIQSKVIAYLSSSFPTHQYNESKCSRDVGYIIDGVATDLLYGGNERSVKSGEFYYKYPSQATGYQIEETVAGIEYAQRLTEVASQNKGTQIGIVSASIGMINDIIRLGSNNIPFALAKWFQTSELDIPQNLTTGRYTEVAGDYEVGNELAIVTSSFSQINSVITNGLSSLPSLVLNTANNIKVTNSTQLTSEITGSSTEVTKVSGSVDIIETIVQNGTGSLPTIVENNTDITNLIKVTNATQFTTGSGADKLQAKIISSSFGTVIDILVNGTGSLPTIVEYETPIDAPKSLLAYTLLKENIGFIQSESIAFMSSSWSTFEYSQSKCERDLAYIISGAAEDLIWNSNSASVINGKYYYEIPSQATGSQLDQTITVIKYASNLAQNIVRNRTYVTASAEVSSSYGILVNNKDFIKNETVAFVSSSWGDFYYDETTCKRDVGYIVDAVATDLLYGGNERSVTAGRYYYDYPSSAIVGGVPSSTRQKDPTVTAINYVKGLLSELVGGAVFQTASNEVEYVYEALRENRTFIQNETIAFVNAKYPNLEYNEASCSRDTGFIVDAVATDLRWGGNQRSREAGRFYYLFPSKATNVQLGETTDAVIYASDLVKEIVLKNTLPIPSASLNTTNNIKVTNATQFTSASSAGVVEISKVSSSFALVSEIVESGTGSLETIVYNTIDSIKATTTSQFTGSLSGSLEDIQFVSESISIVTNIITNGTGSLPAITPYTTPSSDPATLAAYEIIRTNLDLIKNETIAYLSSSWSTASYDESKCRRDVGYIVSGAAEDLIWNSNSASVINGKFYYDIPSQAQGAQLNQTLDGIFYASRLTQELIKNVVFETASVERRAAWDLLKDNTQFIKDETIAYLSSSWSTFEYSESVCRRDIGYIIDAVRTDVLYGGNERTNKAGEFYYLYPSQATGSQLNQTLDGIRYAGRLAEKLVQNIEFVTASLEASQSYQLIVDNKQFIQSESIAYISSSWSTFGYNEETCKRDVGYIVDAVATDILYGGNERSVTAGEFYYKYPSNATTSELEPTTTGIGYAGDIMEKVIVNQIFESPSADKLAGNTTLLRNRSFIQNEVIAYISSSWSNFQYNEASCSRDTGYIVDAVATDLLYGGNERSRTAGEYYFKFPSSATVAGTESPNANAQLYPTIDGIRYANGIAQKLVQNIEFITASAEVSSSWALMRDNKRFIQEEVIAYVSSSWSNVYYNEDKCKRDVGYLIDAAATDLYYGGNERSVTAGSFYYLFPSRATVKGVPSEEAQLDPTIDGVKYASGLSQKVIQNVTFVEPSASVLTGAELLIGNKELIQTEVIEFLSSSWSEFEYNQSKCFRDVGYIIDAVRTDLVYGGNARSIQAGTFYYYIPSVAITEQKPQTVDGINFAMGMSEQVILKEQLVRPAFLTRQSVDLLRGKKKNLQSRAISYTNGAFPNFVYNEEKCYRDTGFIVDAIATDLFYGGNERSIKAAESYYTGVYGSAAVVVNEQKYETAETNRFLRTQFQKIVRNGQLEEFGSLIITTGHDFSYAGAGVTYKALPPNQGGAGVPDPNKEITEIAGGRVYFTSGNELGDFRIGTGLVINQATGTLQGRTFSRSLFSLVTPFSLALEG